MESIQNKEQSPIIKITQSTPLRFTDYQPKFAIPVKNEDLLKELGVENTNGSGIKPVKYAIPVRTCDMDWPELTGKAKTPTPKKPKVSVQVKTGKDSKGLVPTQREQTQKQVRKQLWSCPKKKLGTSMKPPKPQAQMKSNTPNTRVKQNKPPEIQGITCQNHEALNKKIEELNLKIDTLFAKIDTLEKVTCTCTCTCKTTSNESNVNNIGTKNNFEIVEQKLNRGSPVSLSELSIIDSTSNLEGLNRGSPVSLSELSIIDSTSNLEGKKDARSAYEKMRQNVSFLCTPKAVTKGSNLMTPSVRLSKQKLISRMIQKQLLMLDE